MRMYERQVKAGAAFLDEKVPGWLGRIDTETLDVWHCERCILGQLFGQFMFGLNRLDIVQPRDHLGFIPFFDDMSGTLTKEWKRQIKQRVS